MLLYPFASQRSGMRWFRSARQSASNKITQLKVFFSRRRRLLQNSVLTMLVNVVQGMVAIRIRTGLMGFLGTWRWTAHTSIPVFKHLSYLAICIVWPYLKSVYGFTWVHTFSLIPRSRTWMRWVSVSPCWHYTQSQFGGCKTTVT